MHLTVLIENMRREGFELLVGPPTVITKIVDGKMHEPFETVEVQVCCAGDGLFFGPPLVAICVIVDF